MQRFNVLPTFFPQETPSFVDDRYFYEKDCPYNTRGAIITDTKLRKVPECIEYVCLVRKDITGLDTTNLKFLYLYMTTGDFLLRNYITELKAEKHVGRVRIDTNVSKLFVVSSTIELSTAERLSNLVALGLENISLDEIHKSMFETFLRAENKLTSLKLHNVNLFEGRPTMKELEASGDRYINSQLETFESSLVCIGNRTVVKRAKFTGTAVSLAPCLKNLTTLSISTFKNIESISKKIENLLSLVSLDISNITDDIMKFASKFNFGGLRFLCCNKASLKREFYSRGNIQDVFPNIQFLYLKPLNDAEELKAEETSYLCDFNGLTFVKCEYFVNTLFVKFSNVNELHTNIDPREFKLVVRSNTMNRVYVFHGDCKNVTISDKVSANKCIYKFVDYIPSPLVYTSDNIIYGEEINGETYLSYNSLIGEFNILFPWERSFVEVDENEKERYLLMELLAMKFRFNDNYVTSSAKLEAIRKIVRENVRISNSVSSIEKYNRMRWVMLEGNTTSRKDGIVFRYTKKTNNYVPTYVEKIEPSTLDYLSRRYSIALDFKEDQVTSDMRNPVGGNDEYLRVERSFNIRSIKN